MNKEAIYPDVCNIMDIQNVTLRPGSNVTMTETLKSMVDFFDTGVEGESPLPSPKLSPYYLEHTANLVAPDTVPYSLPYQPKACTPRFIVYACACSRHVRPSTCMNLDCIPCQPWTTRRRAFSAFNRLRVKPSTVLYTIFTIPFMQRYRFIDKKSWQKVRTKIWKVLKASFGALYGIEATHPVGDKSTEFHPHLNFLWIQRPGFNPFIDVDMLREKWSAILGVTVSDVHTEYSSHPAKIMHWCKYALRTFPGFMHWSGAVRWYGKYPKMIRQDRVICSECGIPFKPIGYITEDDYNQWYKTGILVGRDPPWQDDNKIVRFK